MKCCNLADKYIEINLERATEVLPALTATEMREVALEVQDMMVNVMGGHHDADVLKLAELATMVGDELQRRLEAE